MGKILKVHNKGENKVELTLEFDQCDLQKLKGSLDFMHIFSEENLDFKSRLVQRGKRESTKYFLVPREFKLSNILNDKVNCTRLETSDSFIYIFKADKVPQSIERIKQKGFVLKK